MSGRVVTNRLPVPMPSLLATIEPPCASASSGAKRQPEPKALLLWAMACAPGPPV